MSFKYKIILMYDLPSKTSCEKRKYREFNKHIKRLGFIMFQHSIYVKTINGKEEYTTIKQKLNKYSAPRYNIRTLMISETKFNTMDRISGEEKFSEKILNSKNKVIKL